MRFKFLLLTLFIFTLSFGQTNGTVTGTISDKDMNNETLPFASVAIKGTSLNTNTDEQGKYTLNVPAGNHTLIVTFLGYESAEVPFSIKAGETKTINHALASTSVQLEDIVIEKTVSRQKETALLTEQKNAVEIKQNIGAQELSRKGVSDVATAVTKTTGITKQEGSGNIFIRGLGDRYNSTTLNGLAIPSNNPERKNIALGIFSTDIVEYISIDKVYSSRIFGDFAGGNVDIISKDYKGDGFLSIGIGSGINTNAVGEKKFKMQDGPNFFGFNKSDAPKDALNKYSFENKLAPTTQSPYAMGLSLAGGKAFNIGETGKLNFFGTISFGNDFSSKDGIRKAVNAQGFAARDFKYESYDYNTNTTGMGSIGYRFNANNKISYNLLFINSSEQSTEEYNGFFQDVANNALIKRATYVTSSLLVNQILGEHTFNERTGVKWGVSYSDVTSDMPDRTQNTLDLVDGQYRFATNSRTDNNRYYQGLKENDISASASVDYKFSKDEDENYRAKVTLGYNGRFKNRDFEARQFNFNINQNAQVDPDNLDTYFNASNFNNGLFSISTYRGDAGTPGAMDPQTYSGDQTVHGAFGNLEYRLNPKLTAIVGIKAERIDQSVEWKTQLDPNGSSDKFERTELLPNLIMKYELNDKNNFRLAASKTYTLPQFKERALFIYEDVTEIKVGNPKLYPSQNYNLDLKWEMFPKSEELISATLYGKYIIDPINEITMASSTNDISYVNVGDWGYVAGIEIEARKLFYASGEENASKVSGGLNASYMHTDQELDSDKVRKETQRADGNNVPVEFNTKNDAFTGASDLLINGDLTFIKEWNQKDASFMATAAYTYFSDRIYSLGTNQKGNLVDKAFGSLDFIIKSKLNKNLGIGFTARNLLNPSIERTQENAAADVLVLSYKRGINFNLNINYQF